MINRGDWQEGRASTVIYLRRWVQNLLKSGACQNRRSMLKWKSAELIKAWKKYHVSKTQRVRESSQGPVPPKLQASAKALYFFFNIIYFNWGLITLQYCIGFAIHQHESATSVHMFQSWTPLPPPSPYHPSRSSQCTSPKHPVSCIEPGLVIRFIYDTIHVSLPFSQIIPPSPSPTESKRLFYTSVSFCCLSYRVIVTIFLNSIYMC